jgi:hypothetical protein
MATLEEVLEMAEEQGLDVGAVEAYYDNDSHYHATEDADDILTRFEDAYRGEYSSGNEYAETMYAEGGFDLGELADYIDWSRVWRDMECEGTWTAPSGFDVYVFIPV